jgi:predicted ABC-type ATPase
MAVERVRERVRRGGHDIPEAVIRRRYRQGLGNLLSLYLPVATNWALYDNSDPAGPILVATGSGDQTVFVSEPGRWQAIREEFK